MIGSGGGFTVADFAGFGFLIGFPYRELPVVPRMQGQVSGGRFPESGLTVAVSRGGLRFSGGRGFQGICPVFSSFRAGFPIEVSGTGFRWQVFQRGRGGRGFRESGFRWLVVFG